MRLTIGRPLPPSSTSPPRRQAPRCATIGVCRALGDGLCVSIQSLNVTAEARTKSQDEVLLRTSKETAAAICGTADALIEPYEGSASA
jgi:hypothetical protein